MRESSRDAAARWTMTDGERANFMANIDCWQTSVGTRAALVVLAVLVSGGGARAGEDEGGLHEVARISGRVTTQERPFSFLTDPSTPSAQVLTLGYTFGLASGIDADRPLPVNMAAVDGSHTFAIGYGVTDRLAPFLSGTIAQRAEAAEGTSANISAGLTCQLTRPGAPLRFSITGAGIHETGSGASGFSAIAAGSYDVGALKLGANVRADKVFASDRDKVDLFALAGVSYRLADWVRVGAEYVAQDLEDAFEDDAEGGARHAVGPTVALDLEGGRYQVTLGSGFGLTANSPRALFRAALAMNF
jgi:hypothetical protein